ncbi:MAG: sulfite exporter TauE/SafE family protein [Pseudomonadota bacterium]
MIPYLVITITALATSGLTMYSGFGLGTILMPAFALFFPVEAAVAAAAVVHGANNLFKIIAVGRNADPGLVLRFGLPAIPAALAGAFTLKYASDFGVLASYSLGAHAAEITPLKLLMAVLILCFALLELLPRLRGLRFPSKYLALGGVLSGFFGGLSGHQGALRSAFLLKTGVTPQAFVGTNAVIGSLVDLTRLAGYGALFYLTGAGSVLGGEQVPLAAAGIIAAFAGVLVGKRFLRKITMKTVETITGIMLLGIALALGAGLV